MKLKITLLTIVICCLAIQQINAQQILTLEDIWYNGNYSAKGVDALNNMNDGLHYSLLNEKDKHNIIEKYNYKTGKKIGELLNSKDLKNPINNEEINFSDYIFSSDEKMALLTTNKLKLYRYSFEAAYVIVDLTKKKSVLLDDVVKQRLPAFNFKGDKVAYVQNNNLYIKDLAANAPEQITFDGKKNAIINGASDWVYEEEFGFDRAFFWNNDGTKIAYYKFDESGVKEFNMPLYNSLYPQDSRFKYPKAGEKNSLVSINIFDLLTHKNMKIPIDENSYEYIPKIKWGINNDLFISTLNRKQTNLNILKVNTETLNIESFYKRTSDRYIDITAQQTIFNITETSKDIFMLSDEGDYNHLYRFNYTTGAKTSITTGNYDVKELLGVDQKNKLIYYSSAEVSPSEEHVYSINFDGKQKRKLTNKQGFNKLSFSKNFDYFINTQSDFNTPPIVGLFETKTLKPLRSIEDNNILLKKLNTLNLNKKELFNFTTNQNVKLEGWIIKPQNFDANKKYPVFQFFYGGPGHNEIEQKWGGTNYMWHQFLAQEGYMVVCVDNRGTGARGNEFKKCTYKQLGKLEVEDQIETAKYLGTLNYIDKTRIACMGWSFGGYLSSLCMTKGSPYFKAGIAVAPVTNWRFYDSIYTERFLETPQDNAKGYDDNSPINFVDKIKNPYLLVHGSADDNVHLQNTMEMSNALVKLNIPFDQFIYTDKSHGISGGKTRLHLYTKMFNFLQKNI